MMGKKISYIFEMFFKKSSASAGMVSKKKTFILIKTALYHRTAMVCITRSDGGATYPDGSHGPLLLLSADKINK